MRPFEVEDLPMPEAIPYPRGFFMGGRPLPTRAEALAFLAELGREIVEQDGMSSATGPSHATAWPVYLVTAIPYVTRRSVVRGAVAFTRRAAAQYVERERQNLTKPEIYVASLHGVPEMRALMRALAALAESDEEVSDATTRE